MLSLTCDVSNSNMLANFPNLDVLLLFQVLTLNLGSSPGFPPGNVLVQRLCIQPGTALHLFHAPPAGCEAGRDKRRVVLISGLFLASLLSWSIIWLQCSSDTGKACKIYYSIPDLVVFRSQKLLQGENWAAVQNKSHLSMNRQDLLYLLIR